MTPCRITCLQHPLPHWNIKLNSWGQFHTWSRDGACLLGHIPRLKNQVSKKERPFAGSKDQICSWNYLVSWLGGQALGFKYAPTLL